MLASGLDVYRFVMIGQISREQHQLVRPSCCRAVGGDKGDCAAQLHLGFVFAQSFYYAGLFFTIKPLHIVFQLKLQPQSTLNSWSSFGEKVPFTISSNLTSYFELANTKCSDIASPFFNSKIHNSFPFLSTSQHSKFVVK